MGERFKHDKGAHGYPLEVELAKGSYKWCACGKTKKVPFCDGTCKGGKPVKFKVAHKSVVALCNCGLTTTPPFCDGASHLAVEVGGAKGRKPKK